MSDILLLPFTGESKEKPVATYSKAGEQAKVGYYAVKFTNYEVSAELAATNRVGMHRYQFGAHQKKRLLVDLGKSFSCRVFSFFSHG